MDIVSTRSHAELKSTIWALLHGIAVQIVSALEILDTLINVQKIKCDSSPNVPLPNSHHTSANDTKRRSNTTRLLKFLFFRCLTITLRFYELAMSLLQLLTSNSKRRRVNKRIRVQMSDVQRRTNHLHNYQIDAEALFACLQSLWQWLGY
jgi:hypothetical protein